MSRASTAFGARLRRLRQECHVTMMALGAVEDPLLVLAGHLPADVEAILLAQPERSLALLREQLGPRRTRDRRATNSETPPEVANW